MITETAQTPAGGAAPAVEPASPNSPQWFFAPGVTPDERARLTEEAIAALKTVFDPEIPCDIYELGLIYCVVIDDSRKVLIDMTLTAPGCPVAGDIVQSVENAVGTVGGVSAVEVNMVFDPPWDQSRMSTEARIALDFY
ncbi:SUF system Fe-S cluster assembly protein [Methylovirgula ligni]|nr:SUF system Fe-S cluster assembly protein [Methylovirgula ligni]